MFRIKRLDHVSLVVADTERAVLFYQDVLGMCLLERPALSFPGAWLQAGDVVLHLLELRSPEAGLERPAHGGRDRHVAFNVDDLDGLKARLTAEGIAFTPSKSGRAALFCRDPDANALEFIQA